MKYDEH